MTGWSAEDKECYHDWKVTIAQEDTLVEQLRAELELEVSLDPAFWDHEQLRRFLRARKHNILKAKIMVEKTVAWRKENGIDTILDDFDFHEREQFHEHYPEGFFCTDKFGRPVYVQRPGDIDCDKLWKFTDLERSVKHHIQQQERYVKIIAPSAALKAGDRRAFQSIVIIDMDAVGVSTLSGEVRTIMGRIMQIDQDYYPELMHKALIINAPTSFRVIWGLVKHLLDARTQEKIEVVGSGYEEELLRWIDADNLMVRYGGNNKARLIDAPGVWNEPEVRRAVLEKYAERKSMFERFYSCSLDASYDSEGMDGLVAGTDVDESASP